MDSLIDSIGDFFSLIFGLAQGGFDGVNQVTGLIIALIAAILMQGWSRLWATAFGAALVHILVGVLRPALDGGSVVLPPMLTLPFWMSVLALFLGYAVVIAVFYFIKSLFTGRGHGRARHAH